MKGSIDITVLIVGMLSMVLLLILSAYTIAQERVETDLYTEVSFNENLYQAQSAHSQLMDESVRRKVGFYQFQGQETKEEWTADIESKIEGFVGLSPDTYSFRGSDGDLKIGNQRTTGMMRFSTYVASPSREGVMARSAIQMSRGE